MLSMKGGKGQLAKDFNAIITIIITEGPINFTEADDVDDYDDDNDDDGERERGERPTGQEFYFRGSFIHHREQNIPAANFLPQYDPLVVAGDKTQGGFNLQIQSLKLDSCLFSSMKAASWIIMTDISILISKVFWPEQIVLSSGSSTLSSWSSESFGIAVVWDQYSLPVLLTLVTGYPRPTHLLIQF